MTPRQNPARQAPAWLRFISGLLIALSVSTAGGLIVLAVFPQLREAVSITSGLHKVDFAENPAAFVGISLLWAAGSAAGMLILLGKKAAYRFAAAFCAAGLVFLSALTVAGVGLVQDPVTAAVFLAAIFGGGCVYFWKNRARWEKAD